MANRLPASGRATRNDNGRRLDVDIAARATWGEPPGCKDSDELRRMVLREWRPARKNTLIGFCSIELPSGLQIDDIAVHLRNGRAWVSFPARPLLDADGQQVVRDGRPQYVSTIRWRNRDLADRFSAAVVELVRDVDPDAFNEGNAG
jgi:hypothetical protein